MVSGFITKIQTKIAPGIEYLISRYELSNIADGKSPKTITWYKEMLQYFYRYIRENQLDDNISSITADTVRGYILFLKSRHKFQGHPCVPEQKKLLSQKTVQCHVRVLKAFSSWLYKEGFTEENRLSNLKLPKAPTTIIQPLTNEEINIIIEIAKKDRHSGFRNYAIIGVLLDTGLRESEIVNAKLSDMNLDKGFMKIMGKGSKERIVPLGKVVTRILWNYIEQQRIPASGKCDNLFLSLTGKPITANAIKLMFSRMAKRTGILRLHAHLCRHTFAIRYLLNGGDIFSLREILGHATLDMVQHYLHFTSAQITEQHHKYSPMDKLYKPKKL